MLNDLKLKYKEANQLMKLIYINGLVFLLIKILHSLGFILGVGQINVSQLIELPSHLNSLLFKPWTLLSYMFVHYNLMHILFNMLWLYFAGQLFLQYFNEKKMLLLYIVGGLAGATAYLIIYNASPAFSSSQSSLIGASASIMSILFAIAYHVPNYKVNLIFLGPVALKYIAAVVLVVDIISIPDSNAGGHIAHIGGAICGLYFIHQWKKGINILESCERGFNRLIFKPNKKTLKTVHKRAKSDDVYRSEKAENVKNVDLILDKIAKSGYDSLSKNEKEQLFNNSKKL